MSAQGAVDHDVLIVGAGLPGLALALALRGSGLRVALVDRQQPAVDEAASWDARIYAISPGNAHFLHAIGVWSRMDRERLTPIETMRVFGDSAGAQLDFSAFDSGERALAWIVEQRELMAATLAMWADADQPETIHADSPPVALLRERDGSSVRLEDGTLLSTRLVVGADGLHSWTRSQAGMGGNLRAYGQTAVVANFATALAHHGRAWQWFLTDGGVLAWLPLPGRRMSMVWSAPEARVQEILALTERELADAVAAAGGSVLGRLEPLTARASFPLTFMRLASPVAPRLALVSDAAHGVHPLAGQGLNLGYGDVEVLAGILRERGAIADPGSNLLLGRYARMRALPTLAMQAMTDGLWRLFNAQQPLPGIIRNRGMAVLNRLPMVKSILMQPAMR
jgi:ubiquinone biosynthesis UbiH/UbiF/VisC/COQ6 family hydroxylase